MKPSINSIIYILSAIILFSNTSVFAKKSSKKAVNKKVKFTTETKWEISCPGPAATCYTIGCGDNIELTEPNGPAKRKQVGSFQVAPNPVTSTHIFLHTDASNPNTGLGYYPATVTSFSGSHANLEVDGNTQEFTDYNTWKSTVCH